MPGIFKHLSYILLFILSVFLSGCTLEQKLARSFVDMEKQGSFYLLQPSFVFKSNLKEYEIPGIDTLDEAQRDSLLIMESLFLKEVSDSLIIHEFVYGFSKALEFYGADVIPEQDLDTVLLNGGTPYVINIAQFSLEEYIHPFSSEYEIYDQVMVIDGFDVNAVNYNAWIELGELNTEKSNKVLFTSDYLIDEVNGSLRQNLVTGKISFDYTIDTITLPRIYEFSRRFGRETATNLFDYLMNRYIDENLPEDYPYERYYYTYDPSRRLIFVSDEEMKIIELDND